MPAPYGQIPERSKGADCKSAGIAFVGSNPTLSTKYRGVEQLVARRAHNPKVVGSSPTPATIFLSLNHADIAQSVERILGKDKVTSSILVISSMAA